MKAITLQILNKYIINQFDLETIQNEVLQIQFRLVLFHLKFQN